jgi:glycosyltransferase involved in cell wall biosynthesis
MKAVHILLKAFQMLKPRDINVQLRIIGEGPNKEKLKRMVEILNITDSVTISGETTDVVKQLQESTIFVLPSLSEGLSNVLLEAMACGLPVVATRVGGNIDLIQDGANGILVEPENPAQLSHALWKILIDKKQALHLGTRARQTVEEKFSMDSVVTNYIELYNELMAE